MRTPTPAPSAATAAAATAAVAAATAATAATTATAAAAAPWWRFPIVWLVLAGPAAVIVAGVATAFIAVRGADPVVGSAAPPTAAQAPAQQARNHAATPR